MTAFVVLALFVIAVFLSGVFSGAETGLYCVNRARLKVQAERGNPRALRLEGVLWNNQAALSLTLVGTNLANCAATACFAFLLSVRLGFSEHQAEVYTTLIVALVIFTFGEVVPKNLFQSHPDRLMSVVSRVLRVANVIFFPAVWVLTLLTTRLTGLFGDQAKGGLDPRRQIALLLREGLASSDHDGAHHEMVDRALTLADTSVHTVMTPRNRVVTIAAAAGRDKLLSLARTKQYSLLPVFKHHPRRIVGIVEVPRLLDDTWQTVGEQMMPFIRLDPHESVASALIRLQQERARMAVVVDRGGYLLGIVTLKDLLEELVGELSAW